MARYAVVVHLAWIHVERDLWGGVGRTASARGQQSNDGPSLRFSIAQF